MDDRQLTLSKAIHANSLLKIYRETTTDTIVSWNDASVLRAKDMSLQEVQLLHLAEETADKVFDTGMSTSPTNTNVWDGQYKRLTALLDPQEDGDAVTLRYVNDKQHGLLSALKNEGATQTSSIVSTGDAQNTRLTNTGDSYVSTMTSLKADATTQASTATTKATEASNSAELAKKWAMSDSSPDGVSGNKSSKTWANEAKMFASNSATSASASQTSATNSANSASASKQSANESANSASASASSASDSATSASKAKVSEIDAANSAKEAKQSEENAKTWDPMSYYTKEQTYTKTEIDNQISNTKTVFDNKISKIFMEKKFMITTKSVGAQSEFRIMNKYDIHVDGYKPLAFAEVYFSGYCTLSDHYWDENEKATLWAFNNGEGKDIDTSLFILYVKDTFR